MLILGYNFPETIGMSSNGRTTAFGAVYFGSNPSVPALQRAQCWHNCHQSMQWFVYMLLCDRKTFYTGFTADISNRLMQHCRGQSFFTKQFSETKLIYCEKYLIKKDAVKREKQIKGWSHSKKQKLLTGELGINQCTEVVEELFRMNEFREFTPKK